MQTSLPPHSRTASIGPGTVQWGAALLLAAFLLHGCGGSEAVRTDAPRPDTTIADATVPAPDSLVIDPTAADPAMAASDSVERDTARTDTLAEALPPDDRPEQVPPDTAGERPAFVDADSLSAFTQDGERIQDLFGNVFVRQDSTRLRSRFSRRYLERDAFLFATDVTIFERGDTLRADTVRYDKNTKVGRARGNVRLTDGKVVVRAPQATYYTEEKRSVFPDSVVLVDSNRVLRARAGEYFSDENRAEFVGDVVLTDPDTYMEADSVTYLRDDDVSIARGNVFIERNPRSRRSAREDTTSRTFLFGRKARNEETRRFSRIEGDALLVRIRTDSAGRPADTLVVASREMEASRRDTLNRLVATGSVRIWQPDLAAVADSAVYDRIEPRDEPADPLGPLQPERPDDPLRARVLLASLPDLDAIVAQGTAADLNRAAPGDPIPDSLRRRRAAADTSARPPRAGPEVDTTETIPREESRLYRTPITWFKQSQVTGDTIRVAARNRSIDTVFVRGRAFAAQEDTAMGKIQQLKGKTITAFFRGDTLQRIVAEPNARAIRFLTDKSGKDNGAAKPSGDRIVIRFADGSVDRVSVLGGVQSEYYQPEDVPSPFRLEGFSWTPERKPTREQLMARPRVRDRLGRAPQPSAPQPDATPPDATPPDTLRATPGLVDSVATGPDTVGRPSENRSASGREGRPAGEARNDASRTRSDTTTVQRPGPGPTGSSLVRWPSSHPHAPRRAAETGGAEGILNRTNPERRR